MTDLNLARGHGAQGLSDWWSSQPSHYRAWVTCCHEVIVEAREARVDVAVLVSEDLVEAFGQAAAAALRPCELLLASAGRAREPRRFTSAGRADDASLRVVEGKDLDLSTPRTNARIPAES